MGMDAEAHLGYGIQIASYDDGYIFEEDTLIEKVDELYWNSNTLKMVYGGYEGSEIFICYKPTVLTANDWTASSYDKLPNLDTLADQYLRNFCKEFNIVQEFKWWLIPSYG